MACTVQLPLLPATAVSPDHHCSMRTTHEMTSDPIPTVVCTLTNPPARNVSNLCHKGSREPCLAQWRHSMLRSDDAQQRQSRPLFRPPVGSNGLHSVK